MRLVIIIFLLFSGVCQSQSLINCGRDTAKFDILNTQIHQYMIDNVAGYKADKWSDMIINPVTGDIGISIEKRVLKSLSSERKVQVIKHSLDWDVSDNEYLLGKYFLTNSIYKIKLEVPGIKTYPVEIKGLLCMIPFETYLDNKKLIESRIDLYKCVIRRVKKSELIN